MTNRFRDPMLRQQYDAAINGYQAKHGDLFGPDGKRRRPMCSWAQWFWQGFDGIEPGVWDRDSKNTLAYAYWRAGQDAANQGRKQ